MDKWLDGWGMGEKGRQRGEFRNKWVDETVFKNKAMEQDYPV